MFDITIICGCYCSLADVVWLTVSTHIVGSLLFYNAGHRLWRQFWVFNMYKNCVFVCVSAPSCPLLRRSGVLHEVLHQGQRANGSQIHVRWWRQSCVWVVQVSAHHVCEKEGECVRKRLSPCAPPAFETANLAQEINKQCLVDIADKQVVNVSNLPE